MDNIIQHGPRAENGVAVSYAEEGAINAAQELYAINNTYINERASSGCFLRVDGSSASVRVINNLIVGSKTILTGPGQAVNNLMTGQPGFTDAERFDFRLTPQAPALGAGINPGKAGHFKLAPMFYYREPLRGEPLPPKDKRFIGACPARAECPD